MRTNPQPEEVRELVRHVLARFGSTAFDDYDLNETILIDDCRLVGRSYQAGEHFAMWLVEVGILQFYDAKGNMLMTVNLFESLEPQRMAA